MTSGIRHRLIAGLLTLAAITVSAAEPDAGALLERLARPASDTTTFVEIRFSALLTEPLVVSGELEHRSDGALIRRVLQPYRETTTVQANDVLVERDGSKPRRFSLDRAPELRGMLTSFGAILKGDRETLDQHFDVAVHGLDEHWRIELSPHDARLRKRLSGIRIDGIGDRPVCMTMEEPDGDATIMALGVPSRDALPSPLARGPLQSWCGGMKAR